MDNQLYHHGVKGMKWGVRRYQNADGTLTPAGKQRAAKQEKKQNMDSDARNRAIAKKVLAGAIMAATVTAAGIYVAKNPDRIDKVISAARNVNLKDLSTAAITKGKKYAKSACALAKQGVKEGVKEALKDAPKKAAKTVVTGVVLNIVKRSLDNAVGKEESARIFQANDNKKIGKFWKVSGDDRDDKED